MPTAKEVSIEVIYSVWGADGQEYEGGIHRIENPSAEFLTLAAAAEAAGVIRVSSDDSAWVSAQQSIQSQEDGEAANAKAFESGDWQKANLDQFIFDTEARLSDENDPNLDEVARAFLETGLRDAKSMQKLIEDGATYDEAVDRVKAGEQ